MAKLTFWFEFASTYSYLSAMRIEPMAKAAGVEVEWKPFLLGPIFAAQGWKTSPFKLYPAKGVYMWRDLERLCAERGLGLVPLDPHTFPQNGLMAARVAIAALEAPGGPAFVKEMYLAQFRDGQIISEPEVVMGALTRAGLSADLLSAAKDDTVKQQLRANTEAAMEIGLFGAPSFTVRDEMFWGDDRLEQALAWSKAEVE
ncbi:MAG: 2-hydroxychromene-2-carboxylate isomerase [Pseudomonadota bacterium]